VSARSALLTEPRSFALRNEPVPEPGPGEVRVKVAECGICGSDLKMYSGGHPVHRPPLLLGHELVGEVDAVGPGVSLAPGTAVAAFPAIGCGDCYACDRGQEQLCARMRLIGGHEPGGLSDYVLMPERNAVPILPEVPLDRRVLIEPLAVAVHAVGRAGLGDMDRCLIVGAGPIGILTAVVLRAEGVRPLVVADRDRTRLALAARLGFETAATESDFAGPLLDGLGQPEGFEVVFDCAGGAGTPDLALACTVPAGRVVLVGVPPRKIALDSVVLQRGDRSLIGSMMYSRDEFERAMELLGEGAIPDSAMADGLVRRTFPLERVTEAFATLANGQASVLKVVISPSRSDAGAGNGPESGGGEPA
jgi:2-desacetyl-2-hydroxyethyl bacteriochlorophyllide A dehydrogenase